MSYLLRRVLAKPRLILDEMCRLYGKFVSYFRRVSCKTRLTFPRIIGPNVYFEKVFIFKFPSDCKPRLKSNSTKKVRGFFTGHWSDLFLPRAVNRINTVCLPSASKPHGKFRSFVHHVDKYGFYRPNVLIKCSFLFPSPYPAISGIISFAFNLFNFVQWGDNNLVDSVVCQINPASLLQVYSFAIPPLQPLWNAL